MTLRDILSDISEYNRALTIYAELPWDADSRACVRDPDATDADYPYFLEIEIAADLAEDLMGSANVEVVDRIISYAIHDA